MKLMHIKVVQILYHSHLIIKWEKGIKLTAAKHAQCLHIYR